MRGATPRRRTSGASAGGAPAQAPSSTSTTTTTTGEFRLWEHNPPEVRQLRAGGEVPDGLDLIFDDPACGSTSIPVEAVVVDQSPIRSVTLHWSFVGRHGEVTGSTAMQPSAGKYVAVVGPFPAGTAPDGASATIRWWVDATDKNGNVGRADVPDGSGGLGDDERITLSDCAG